MLVEELDEGKVERTRALKRFRLFYWVTGYIILPLLYLFLTLIFH